MEKIVFTEEHCHPETLFPFTLTRAIQELRIGALTIREKWERLLDLPSFSLAGARFSDSESVALDESLGRDTVFLINSNLLPTADLARQLASLKPGERLTGTNDAPLAACLSRRQIQGAGVYRTERIVAASADYREIRFPWDLVRHNAWAIEQDWQLLTRKRQSQGAPRTTSMINAARVFIEKGARVDHCILNATEGPIYIGNGAQVMEGSLLRGPVAICEGAVVKMGTKIYGATTVGPWSTAGGEIRNSLFQAFSNKAHDGYLGDSVLGEWCNLGAGTSNSNVKNNASVVRVQLPAGVFEAGTKCGMFMGDYSRTAINTAINTGSVIGVSCNVFGGMPPKLLRSFAWGSAGTERYELERALQHIANWKAMKGQELTPRETAIIKDLYERY